MLRAEDCLRLCLPMQRLIGMCFFADATAFAFGGFGTDLGGGTTISAGTKSGSSRYASPTACLVHHRNGSDHADHEADIQVVQHVHVTGNLRTSDFGGPYNLSLLNVQEAEVKSKLLDLI